MKYHCFFEQSGTFKKENKKVIMSKEELIQFCIDLIKTIEKHK